MAFINRQLLDTSLMYENNITKEQLDLALKGQVETDKTLGNILIKKHLITEKNLAKFLSKIRYWCDISIKFKANLFAKRILAKIKFFAKQDLTKKVCI